MKTLAYKKWLHCDQIQTLTMMWSLPMPTVTLIFQYVHTLALKQSHITAVTGSNDKAAVFHVQFENNKRNWIFDWFPQKKILNAWKYNSIQLWNYAFMLFMLSVGGFEKWNSTGAGIATGSPFVIISWYKEKSVQAKHFLKNHASDGVLILYLVWFLISTKPHRNYSSSSFPEGIFSLCTFRICKNCTDMVST